MRCVMRWWRLCWMWWRVVLKVVEGCAEGGGGCAECGDRAEGGGGCAERGGDRAEGGGGCEWCAMCAMGTRSHVLHAIRYVLPHAALRAVSAGIGAPCPGGREGCAACAVCYSSMGGVRCMLEAG